MAGENKLSRSLDGTELLTYSYNKIKTSNVEQFIVVSSKENEPQASLLSHPYPSIVLQKEQNQGIGDSIALGVSHIKKKYFQRHNMSSGYASNNKRSYKSSNIL